MSILYDSFRSTCFDGFRKSRLNERDAHKSKNGYVYQGYQGPPEQEWVDDTHMYRYPEDVWVVRSGPTSRNLKGPRAHMETPAVCDAAYSMGGPKRGRPAGVRKYTEGGWTAMKDGPMQMSTHAFQTGLGRIHGRIRDDAGGPPDSFAMYQYTPKEDAWSMGHQESDTHNWFNMHSASLRNRGYYYGGEDQPGGEKSTTVTRHRRYSPNAHGLSEAYIVRQPLLDAIHNGTGGGLALASDDSDDWAFLMGGVDAEGGVKSITRAYSPERDSWRAWNGGQRRASRMPGARSHAAAFILAEFASIFVTGGSNRPEGQEATHNTNLRFDARRDVWQTMTAPIPSRRFKHGAFSL